MTLTGNLALRITMILIAGFVLLQAAMALTLLVPSSERPRWPVNLPEPARARVLVEAIERAAPPERARLLDAIDNGLFTLRLEPSFPRLPGPAAEEMARAYRRSLPGRRVAASAGRGIFARAATAWIGPGRFLAPPRVAVALQGGQVLLFEGRPSEKMRAYLRRRAFAGALGGLMLLLVIGLAVAHSTRPLVRLTRQVRRMGPDVALEALPVTGPRETRELAAAFNELQGRIAALIAERTHMLAAIAHDLRTYLTRLRLRVEYIDDADQRARAGADLDEMALLLDDSLLLAQADGRAEPPAEIDLEDELAALVAVRREMGDPVTLEAAAKGSVRASRLALRRVFANLIDNGLRYGGGVTVRLEREGDAMRIAFQDRGPGVPQEMLARLGEPFLRAEPSRARATGGAGLGLAIVRALVAGQGGRVTFANRPDGGFEAAILLPRLGGAAG